MGIWAAGASLVLTAGPLAGGGLITLAQTIIVGAYPPEKLSQANAIFGIAFASGSLAGAGELGSRLSGLGERGKPHIVCLACT